MQNLQHRYAPFGPGWHSMYRWSLPLLPLPLQVNGFAD